jgi:hypothetical protein
MCTKRKALIWRWLQAEALRHTVTVSESLSQVGAIRFSDEVFGALLSPLGRHFPVKACDQTALRKNRC